MRMTKQHLKDALVVILGLVFAYHVSLLVIMVDGAMHEDGLTPVWYLTTLSVDAQWPVLGLVGFFSFAAWVVAVGATTEGQKPSTFVSDRDWMDGKRAYDLEDERRRNEIHSRPKGWR